MPKKWFALSVAGGREEQVRDAIMRRARGAGKENLFGDIVFPTEKKVSIARGGRRTERELAVHSGYLYIEVDAIQSLDDPDMPWQMSPDAYYLVKDVPGVGNFVGRRVQEGRRSVIRPSPMDVADVRLILKSEEAAKEADEPSVALAFNKGDQVKIKSGDFENFEGTVEEVLPAKGMVRVTVYMLGRATPVELEYWRVVPVTS
jgi:transcriptional antiterminator NusG